MDLIRQLAALALVFGLLALALWLLRGKAGLKWKRTGRARGRAPHLESLDRLALSPQHALHLVRAADRVLILVTHAGGCTLLAQVPPAAPAATTSVGQAVSPVLRLSAQLPSAAPDAASLRRTADGAAFERLAS